MECTALKRFYVCLHFVVAEDLWTDVFAGRREDCAAIPMDEFVVEVRC